ncbi:hypothetical protein LguiB_032300 [Lonicera macranthoides]
MELRRYWELRKRVLDAAAKRTGSNNEGSLFPSSFTLAKLVVKSHMVEDSSDKEEDPHYGYVDNGRDYESVIGYSSHGGGPPQILALRLQLNQP